MRRRLAALGGEARIVAGLLLALAGALLAFWARQALIEPDAIGAACADATAPWWCVPRHGLVMLFHLRLLGGAALALSVLAAGAAMLGRAHRDLAFAALACAGAGLVLYNASLSAPAALLAGLLLAGRHQRPGEAGGLGPDRAEPR
jgi:hypothetical protein